MSSAERQRRFLDRLRQTGGDSRLRQELAELQRKNADLRQKNAELRRRLAAVTRAPRSTLFLKAGDRRKVLSALHPDRTQDPEHKRRLTVAFQIFNALPIREIPDDDDTR